MRPLKRRLRLLSGATWLVLVVGLLVGVGLANRSVERAADDVLLAEASTAVALWSMSGEEGVEEVFGGRWEASDGSPEGLDRPEIAEVDGGIVARAALYDADGWSRVGTLTLRPDPDTRPGVPVIIVLMLLASMIALVAAAGWWVEDVGPGRKPGPWLAALAFFLPLSLAGQWADGELARLTDYRLGVAVQALVAVPETESLAGRPGATSRLTGLPLLVVRDGAVAATTLLPGVAEGLAALPDPPPSRTEVNRTPYALRDLGVYRLSMVPYEHTRSPWAPMLGVFLVAMVLGTLPRVLAPTVTRPRELKRNLEAWSFLAPAAVHLAVFTIGPLIFAAWLSFHRWNLVDVARPFVGLGNYLSLLSDGAFWNSVWNTAVFTLHVPVAMAVALLFAILVHRRTRTLLLVRTALFLPSITSLVAIAVVWQWILNTDYGILNWLLSVVGMGPVPWLTSPSTALLAIMILGVWMVVGYQMVLFQAGLAAIPEELYEAARIDGAGPWQRFVHVTLPGLRHTLFFVLVTSVIGSFQIFGAVYVMTEGGPLGSTDVAVYHIYKEAWEFLRFGSAAAQSWVLFAIIFAVTWLHFRLLERRAEEA